MRKRGDKAVKKPVIRYGFGIPQYADGIVFLYRRRYSFADWYSTVVRVTALLFSHSLLVYEFLTGLRYSFTLRARGRALIAKPTVRN
jgi:hypothetical protein